MDDLDGFQPIKPFNNREHLTSRHRLRGFDYTNPGYYFVTVCTHRRQLLFGECTTGEMRLSPAGSLMHALLANRPESAEVSIDAFVVMPNHIHILFYLSLDNVENTISSEMKWFKGVGRSQYAAGVRAGVLAPYREKLW